MRPDRKASKELPWFVSKTETAHLMGVSVRTITRMIKAGTLPAVGLRRRKVISRNYLEALAGRK
jgi:excisionase family DNA binding protein